MKTILGVVLAALVAACDSSSSGGGTPIATTQLAPLFRGLKGAATAGGAVVRLDWRAAEDEATPAGQIRYQIFVSATAGGQDFNAAPALTTAGGATSAILTSANSALIAVGQTAFFVVRALDGDGLSDENRVELVVHFVDAAQVAHVDDTAAGPGTLGDSTDPFPSIQAAIDAVEGNGGGLVLVSAEAGGSSYETELDIDDDTVTCIALYGGFPRFAGLASPTAILTARDVANFVTNLDADFGDLADEDLVRIVNGFALTIVDGFTFRGFDGGSGENFAIRGIQVHLQVSCCTLLDTAIVRTEGMEPVVVEQLAGNGPSGVNDVYIVGNSAFRDVDDEEEFSVDVFQCAGPTGRLHFQNNTTDEQSSSLDADTAVPPTGQHVLVSHNLMTGGSSTVDLLFDPVDALNGGALTVVIEFNEVRDASSDAFQVGDLSDVGANGSATLTMHRNFVQGVSSDPIEVECLGDEAHAGVDVTITIRDNIFSGSNSIGVDASLTASADRDTRLTVFNNFFSVGESESMEIDSESSVTDDVHNLGRLHCTTQRNVIFGGLEDLQIELGNFPGGRTHVVVCETTVVNSEDEGFRLNPEGQLGSATAELPMAYHFWTVFNNDVRAGDDEAMQFSDDRGSEADSEGYFLIANNLFGMTSDPGSASGVEFRASSARNGCYLFQRNFMGLGGSDSEDAIEISTSASSFPNLIRLYNNTLAFSSGSGIEIDPSGPQPQIVNNTVSFNSQDGNFGIESNGIDPQAFIHNCIVSHNARDLERRENVKVTFTLVRDEADPAGLGNLGGEPFFLTGPEQFLNGIPLGDEVLAVRDLFTLRPGSPAVDRGNADPIFNDPDGTRNDMGVFGGPGAGTIGPLVQGSSKPFVFLGGTPKVDLFTGAQLTPNDGRLSFAFSRPVDAATIGGGILVRSGGATVPGTFQTSAGGHIATFIPTATLSGGDLVEVSITTGLRAVGGTPHWYPLTFRFGTRPATTIAEAEPNDVNDGAIDNLDTAAAQALGTGPVFVVGGTLTDNTDVDVYSFDASAGQRVMVRLNGTVPSCTPRLELRNAAGEVLATGRASAFTGEGISDPYLDHVVAATGTVFLVVFDPDEAPINSYEFSMVLD